MAIRTIGNICCTGSLIKKQGYSVGVIDLILATIAVLIGFSYYNPHLSDTYIHQHEFAWETVIIQMLLLPFQFLFPINYIQHHLPIFTLLTFFVESCLFILMIVGIRKFDSYRMRIWFRIRLFFFFLTFVSLVIRTINSRFIDDPFVILKQGSLGILYLTYRGYGLLVITFLEELAYKSLNGNTYRLV